MASARLTVDAIGLSLAAYGFGDLDRTFGHGDDSVAGLHLHVFDLAAVAVAVETDDDKCNAGGREGIE